MGRPKKNKKAEIKARRKTRKSKERIADLRRRESRARATIKMLTERAELMEKLAEEEANELLSDEPSSVEDAQSSQSTSE